VLEVGVSSRLLRLRFGAERAPGADVINMS